MNTNKKTYDLLSLGEILLRLSPPGNERIERGNAFQKQVGGAELNVVSGVSQLGLYTGMISRLPANSLGTYAKNQIRFCGVSDDYLIYDSSAGARLGLYYYESGAYPRKPAVVYDRQNSSFCGITPDEFPEELYASTRCFHTSGITLGLTENTRKTGIEMIKRFKEHGALISFDVNYRMNLWSGQEARSCIESILPYVDIFFCSEDTARLTFGKTGDIHSILWEFTREYPISIVASTRRIVHSPKVHSFGSLIYQAKQNRFYMEDPYRNIEVVDRIGSGDAYVAGVLYGLLSSDFDCQRALEYGNAASAVKNTVPGDLASCSNQEITQIIREHQAGSAQSEMNR
ncbi:MAG: sugar kinase [Blautia sp.]|nr:sugar kinase [Blautia sp.]